MEGFKIVLLLAGVVGQIAAAPQLISAALSAGLTASGLGPVVTIAKIAGDTETMGKALDLAGNATRWGTYMVKNVSESGSTVARVGLSQATGLGGTALQGGIGIGKQGISFVESAAKHFPGGNMMSFITPAANVGLDVAGKLGGIVLNATAKGGDKILHVGNQVVQSKAELVNTGAQKVIDAGRVAVGKIGSVKNSINGLSSGLTSGMTSAVSSGLNSVGLGGLSSMISNSASSSQASLSGQVSSSGGLTGRLTSLFG